MAKAKQVQLQTDITNEDEWAKFLQREGLLVVDIYSEWCGPCTAMQGNLKKIKLEYGGDFLQLGMARCDYIEDLKRFRNRSEPTWMFLARTNQVNLLFGSNAPELQRTILEEMSKEKECLEGSRVRNARSPSDYSDQEQAFYNKLQAFAVEREKQKAEMAHKQLKERRIAQAKNILDTMAHLGLIVIFPHAINKFQDVIDQYLPDSGIAISKKDRPQLTNEALEDIEFLAQEKDKIPDECRAHLISDKCMAVMLTVDQEAVPGPLDETVLKFAYGPSKLGPGEPGTPAYDLLKSQIAKRDREEREAKAQLAAAEALEAAEAAEAEEDLMGMEEGDEEGIEEEGEEEEEKVYQGDMPMDHVPGFDLEDLLEAPVQDEEDDDEVEEDLWGLWAPSSELVKSTALKYCFPLITSALILPEPEPTPPHFAVAFELIKKYDVFKLINEYESEVMAYGFFTSDQHDAELIAKSKKGYEKKFTGTHGVNDRLIVKIAKRRSDPILAFAQLGPTYMSSNAETGEKDCVYFFPEDYDEPEPEEPQKKSVVADNIDGAVDDMVFDSVIHGEDADFAELEGEVEEIPPMDPSELPQPEEGEEDEGQGQQVDKGTSPAPPGEEAPPGEGEAPPEGTAPPAEGEAPPAEGAAPPAEGEAPPAEGAAPPEEAAAPPAESEAPPAESEAPPAESEAPPAESEPPPEAAE